MPYNPSYSYSYSDSYNINIYDALTSATSLNIFNAFIYITSAVVSIWLLRLFSKALVEIIKLLNDIKTSLNHGNKS